MQLQALLTASLLLLLFCKKDGISSAAEPGYLDFDNLPETNFSCESKVIGGYYADVETGCQMFHVCTIGQKGEITDIKFLCLNGTVFDQETRVCERLDEVDCSKTESFFDLNLQLYGNKGGPYGGIEPENEEIVEEECDPEDEEECQRTEDGGVREEEEELESVGGGRETVPSNNNKNNAGVIQQTTFSPVSVATTTTKRPNVFSSTSTARVPTTTLQPSTTGQPAFQSGDPDTIAALLALHNAFAQSLQHHDINNKQQQEQQQAQQQEQIDQQQREIEEHQRKQHLQQIQQQKQQAQLQHQQAQLQHHQAQLHHQQQKIQQQHTKQSAAAYAAAVIGQSQQPQTPKPSFQPLPPPPPPLPLPHPPPQTPQTHRFPSQSHYESSKHPTNTPQQQDSRQQIPQQPNHRFPQIHFEASKHPPSAPQQDSPQHRYPPQIHYEAPKLHPVTAQQQERFGGAYVQSQQNFGQNVRLPVQSTDRSKPFSFHQYETQQPSTTASPYLLHQLKVNRVKQEQQHNNFPRQAQRSITTPAVAVVTSTSTTTSIRSAGSKSHPGAKGAGHTGTETFLGSSVTSSSSEVQPGNATTSGEYDEYQEGDVATDPFFQDVPKIGRVTRGVGDEQTDAFFQDLPKIGRVRRDVGEEGNVQTGAFFQDVPKIGRVRRDVGEEGNVQTGAFFQDVPKIGRVRRDVGEEGDVQTGAFFQDVPKIGRDVVGPTRETIRENYKENTKKNYTKMSGHGNEENIEKYHNKMDEKLKTLNKNINNLKIKEQTGRRGLENKKNLEQIRINKKWLEDNKKPFNKNGKSVQVVTNGELTVENGGKTTVSDFVGENSSLSSNRLENINIYKIRKLVKREAKYVSREEEDSHEDNRVARKRSKSNRSKNARKSSKSRRKSSRNRSKAKGADKIDRDAAKGRKNKDRYVEKDREDVEKVRKNKKNSSKIETTTTTTTQSPMDTTTIKSEEGVKNIPLDNNEFTDIIDNVQRTISAKVVSIKQPYVYRNKEIKDNLQLSPEERKYFAEVSAVMSKYIPPATDNGDSLESTPNMSARDKQRLSMFVTSKEKKKKKNGIYVRYRRQAEKDKKQYEVSEVVDEPTTAEPSARRLINQYRTSGIVPSQLISELIQRMDVIPKEQTTTDAVRQQKTQSSTSNLRTHSPIIGGQVRNRALSPHRNYEKAEVMKMNQERNDPNTQSLRDVISNGGHHRMAMHDPGMSSSSYRGHQPDEIVSKNGKVEVEPKLSSRDYTLKKEDSDPGGDYSLEKEESHPRSSISSYNGRGKEGSKETYAVSEEDVGDERPSTYRPFLLDQVGRANTGDVRFSESDRGLSTTIPVGDMSRGKLLFLDTNERHQEASRTNVGSQEITRTRSRPSGSHRQTTKILPVEETHPELSGSVSMAPRRRRPTSRGRERPEETSSESSGSNRNTESRRRRPVSRGRESLEEIPKDIVDSGTSTRQSQRSRSRQNSNLSAVSSDTRSRSRTSVMEDGSRSAPDSSRSVPDSSRSVPDSSRSVPDSFRSVPDSSRSVPDSSRSSPDSSRSVLDSSRSVPDSSRSVPDSSRSVPDSSRSVPSSSRSVTSQSRRRPSNFESEKVENGEYIVNTQATPRENRISRTRRPTSTIPKEIATESSDNKDEEQVGETTESYDSRAKKLKSQLFPGENFTCEGKIKGGFYADMESDCRGFFICSQGEINGPLLKSHFWCGEATKFNQRSRTCQADYVVECSISPRYFGLNNDFAVPTLETDTFEPRKIS